MKITEDYLIQRETFDAVNIMVPNFDPKIVRNNTKNNPEWVHFGGGNLYRCFHAKVAQDLINAGELNTGIVVVETLGENLIKDLYHRFDNRSLTVTMKADGGFDKELIASTAEALFLHPSKKSDVQNLESIFKNESLKLVTLTITEKGYAVKDSAGNLLQQVVQDIQAGPTIDKLQSTMAKLTYLLLERFNAGALPLAVVSTDNFSHNGDRLKAAVLEIATGWLKQGFIPNSFIEYLDKGNQVSFPFSMIDRITPLPNVDIAKKLEEEGIEEMMPYKTGQRGNELAAFVNTEEVHYLVIEDDFPNGRPAFEKANGVLMGNRETVNNADLMKVCTCLNPLHTTLAIYGCLLGFDRIYKEVQDKDLLKLIEQIGFVEGLPVVKNPEIINPDSFIKEVIYKRFMNPNIPDTPQRIASDTSQKVGIRFGETLKAYVSTKDKDVETLHFIPLTIAAWCRYLMAIDDNGQPFTPSPDPLYEELHSYVSTITLGETADVHAVLHPILSNKEIFSVNLEEIGLGEKIENYFARMITGPHAVRQVLEEELAEHAIEVNK
jgi:fructuronate reductase